MVPSPDQEPDWSDGPGRDHGITAIRPGRLAQARPAAASISAAGRLVSRRTLRATGIHAFNAELGTLVISLKAHPLPSQDPALPLPR